MPNVTRNLSLLALAALLTACATTPKWSVSGADRKDAVVKVSYEYPEFHQPKVTDEQAFKAALGRCSGWGYDDAQLIAGQVRECANSQGANCNLWMVTREYQCIDDAPLARQASDSTRFRFAK